MLQLNSLKLLTPNKLGGVGAGSCNRHDTIKKICRIRFCILITKDLQALDLQLQVEYNEI